MQSLGKCRTRLRRREPRAQHESVSCKSWSNSCSRAEKRGSQRRGVGFAGADADGVVDVIDEDFAVTDLAGLGRGSDGIDDLVDLIAGNSDFDLDLWQEIHGVFGTAVD